MKIVVGSLNPAKVEVTRNVLSRLFPIECVEGMAVKSCVSKQPQSLLEMFEGARFRAKSAWCGMSKPDFGVGLESGIFKVDFNVWMDACACAIWNGDDPDNFGVGVSSAFHVPPAIMSRIASGQDMTEAVVDLGWGENSIREVAGLSSLITNGQVLRTDQVEQALLMAAGRFTASQYWDEESP